MNNTMVVDHCGLFIYLDVGHQGSFHVIIIQHQSNLYKSWCQFSVQTNEYFEYLVKDLSYLGEKMFVMH
jgi:hypothetical protein